MAPEDRTPRPKTFPGAPRPGGEVSEPLDLRQTGQVDILVSRMSVLEAQVDQTSIELAKLSVAMGTLTGKIDSIFNEATEARRERVAREQRDADRAAAELQFRRDRALKVISTVVPTITSLGAAVAAVIAAIYASGAH